MPLYFEPKVDNMSLGSIRLQTVRVSSSKSDIIELISAFLVLIICIYKNFQYVILNEMKDLERFKGFKKIKFQIYSHSFFLINNTSSSKGIVASISSIGAP